LETGLHCRRSGRCLCGPRAGRAGSPEILYGDPDSIETSPGPLDNCLVIQKRAKQITLCDSFFLARCPKIGSDSRAVTIRHLPIQMHSSSRQLTKICPVLSMKWGVVIDGLTAGKCITTMQGRCPSFLIQHFAVALHCLNPRQNPGLPAQAFAFVATPWTTKASFLCLRHPMRVPKNANILRPFGRTSVGSRAANSQRSGHQPASVWSGPAPSATDLGANDFQQGISTGRICVPPVSLKLAWTRSVRRLKCLFETVLLRIFHASAAAEIIHTNFAFRVHRNAAALRSTSFHLRLALVCADMWEHRRFTTSVAQGNGPVACGVCLIRRRRRPSPPQRGVPVGSQCCHRRGCGPVNMRHHCRAQTTSIGLR
jgi:hypothetical protein